MLGTKGGITYVSDTEHVTNPAYTEALAACPNAGGKSRITGGGIRIAGIPGTVSISSSRPLDLASAFGDDDLINDDYWEASGDAPARHPDHQLRDLRQVQGPEVQVGHVSQPGDRGAAEHRQLQRRPLGDGRRRLHRHDREPRHLDVPVGVRQVERRRPRHERRSGWDHPRLRLHEEQAPGHRRREAQDPRGSAGFKTAKCPLTRTSPAAAR